jgi:PASTA domain-containing protein
MITRAPTTRAIEVPDLVGDKADQAIQQLRALGLMPITWSAAVDDVKDAGFVLGLDPPPGSPVRPKAHVTMSVATHPDFQGHADDGPDAPPDPPVQTPLTWPLSSPTGFAAPTPAPTYAAFTDASPTAATSDAPSAPASSPIDAAFREVRHGAVGPSSAAAPPPGVAADLYALDVSAPVPTPDEISTDADWERLRAPEAARHAADPNGSTNPEAAPTIVQPTVAADEAASPGSAEALEEQARREARRRSARCHRRLTLKQKMIVGGVLALTLLIVLGAMSGHKPVGCPAVAALTAPHRATPPARTATTPAPVAPHKHPKARKPRVIVRWRTRTRVVRVKVRTPAPSNPQPSGSSPATPVSAGPSTATASSTGAGVAQTSSGAPANHPATSTPSHQPASTPSSADSRSSGHGGGSTLQTPDGSTAPPQP